MDTSPTLSSEVVDRLVLTTLSVPRAVHDIVRKLLRSDYLIDEECVRDSLQRLVLLSKVQAVAGCVSIAGRRWLSTASQEPIS